MARTIRLTLTCLALLTTAGPAYAQRPLPLPADAASVPLADVIALAQPYPNLRQEIRLAQIAAGSNPTATACTGRRLGPEWVTLKDRAIGPYRCRIGQRTLDLSTNVTFFDGARYKLDPAAPDRAAKAKSLRETRLVWRWL